MTKGLWVYCPSPMFVSKNRHFPILLHFFVSVPFLEQFPSRPPSSQFFSFFSFSNLHPQPCFHKSYPQFKTFLNIRAVPGSAVFCSNAVLITIPSSSIHFFSFFDMLPSAPTTTGMTYLVFLPWSLFYITQNLHFFIFSNTVLSNFHFHHTIFHFSSGCISCTISSELFLQHYHAFSCAPFVPTFCIRSQCKILFHFLVTHSTKWWLGCFIYLVFHIVCSKCLFLCSTQNGFCFNFQVSFSQLGPCFFFICCF